MSKQWRCASSAVVCAFVVAVAMSGSLAHAQTFAADLVIAKAGAKADDRPGRVYVSGDKVRIETPDFAGSFFVIDGDRGAAWFVRPKQWVFMDAKQSSPLTQVFVTVDPADPCRQWDAMETIAGVAVGGPWECSRIGAETLDGRDVVKFHVVSRTGRVSVRWVDPQRAFPVRFEGEDGSSVAVAHISDAPQPASLFAIPAAYQKFDPLVLIERIKQSDVWVEPPKK
jgi:hypothetical protein